MHIQQKIDVVGGEKITGLFPEAVVVADDRLFHKLLYICERSDKKVSENDKTVLKGSSVAMVLLVFFHPYLNLTRCICLALCRLMRAVLTVPQYIYIFF